MKPILLYPVVLSFILSTLPASLLAQKPSTWTSGEIYQAIQKLNFLGSAMYIAAHPDDENPALISYLSHEIKANVTYLSLSRGEGGQNRIGTETNELLGILRTQELIAARKIDGGNQIFTRAKDFGYSKTPEETLSFWRKDEILSDIVWAMRKHQPDIIINRFYYEKDSALFPDHGHHTASALLAYEAFELAKNKTVYPEQLTFVSTWQPQRMFFNASWFFYGAFETLFKDKLSQPEYERRRLQRQKQFETFRATHPQSINFDVGTYYAHLGKSNNEISAESRSLHKSQGFGTTGFRGKSREHLILLKGNMPHPPQDLFAGINTSWTRLAGGSEIGEILKKVEENFDFEHPALSVQELMKAYKLIQELPKSYWKLVKLEEIRNLIKACLGFYGEASTPLAYATPGERIQINLEATNRSDNHILFNKVNISPTETDTVLNITLGNHEPWLLPIDIRIPTEENMWTSPYWLHDSSSIGLNHLDDPELTGLPETPRTFGVRFFLNINGQPFDFFEEIVSKKTDLVKGEVYQPFEIVPPVSLKIEADNIIFTENTPQKISVAIKAFKDNLEGELSFRHSKAWRVEPGKIEFDLSAKGEEKIIAFKLYPPQSKSEGDIVPVVKIGNKIFDKEISLIDYDHIPVQTVLKTARKKLVKIDLKKKDTKIAYIQGSGDAVPSSLEQIGYDVRLLNLDAVNPESLHAYETIILGIRAYNSLSQLKFHQSTLMTFVKEGGTLIVQYNTHTNLVIPMDQIGPYPFRISRNRVANEQAEVRFLAPDHPVLNYPNKITDKDFEGWVQERGLYFPDEWDKRYTPILSSNDVHESPLNGGLLIAKYGKGFYVYTGYSWFRELPAGVSGAYRLFVNMISLGH